MGLSLSAVLGSSCGLCALWLATCAWGVTPFDGLWRADPSTDCTATGLDGGALRIEDNVLYGVDNQCEMTLPVDVRDMDAVLYDMACEGDGARWTDRAMLLRGAEGGLILVWNGYAFAYEACPAIDTPQSTAPDD